METRGSHGGPGNAGMSVPRLAPGNPANPHRSRSLSLSSSTPIGVSTTPATAGSTSQGESAQTVSSADPTVVQRMDEEGEVAHPLDPCVQSGEDAAGPTG